MIKAYIDKIRSDKPQNIGHPVPNIDFFGALLNNIDPIGKNDPDIDIENDLKKATPDNF